jgi:hypothetical protein
MHLCGQERQFSLVTSNGIVTPMANENLLRITEQVARLYAERIRNAPDRPHGGISGPSLDSADIRAIKRTQVSQGLLRDALP